MPTIFACRETSRNTKLRGLGINGKVADRHDGRMPKLQPILFVHLRAWRKSRGMTLEQVANLIYSKPNTLSDWELGKRHVDLAELAKLAEVYGVEPAALLYAPEGSAELDTLRSMARIAKLMKPSRLRTWLETGRALAEQDDE